MQAQLEGRSVLAGIRRQGETGNRDQQGLNGDQISDDHAQERSPEMRAFAAQSDHCPPPAGPLIIEIADQESNVGKRRLPALTRSGEANPSTALTICRDKAACSSQREPRSRTKPMRPQNLTVSERPPILYAMPARKSLIGRRSDTAAVLVAALTKPEVSRLV